jgi:hypothetical protein
VTSEPLDWKEIYRLAVVETDPAKRSRRISEARNSIFDRLEESSSKPGHPDERQELTDALNGLRVLQQGHEGRVQPYRDEGTSQRKTA